MVSRLTVRIALARKAHREFTESVSNLATLGVGRARQENMDGFTEPPNHTHPGLKNRTAMQLDPALCEAGVLVQGALGVGCVAACDGVAGGLERSGQQSIKHRCAHEPVTRRHGTSPE